MTTFKEFLTEEKISTSKRKTIVHFQDMKPTEFLQFAHKLIDDFNGKLDNISTELKVDGFGARFGKDSDGEFFFETSRSGPIQKSKSFSTYTKTKDATELMIQRAVHYDDLFDILKESELWHNLPNDCKVFAEFLYNPMAIEEDGYLKFVSVKYNKKKLGKILTIVPIKVVIASSGATHHDEREVLSELFKESNHDIKIVSPKLKHLSVDVSAKLQPISLFGDKVKAIIKSLKHSDKQQKQEYLAVIDAVKDEIAEVILQHPIKGRDILGTEIEGIIVEIDGKNYKITTPKFKQQKKKEST